MSVPSNDINNIMDFLMKKDDDNNHSFHQKMESMDVGYGGNVSDSFLAETWPMSEDFMDNIFSMDDGLLGLGAADNNGIDGLGMEPAIGTAASLAGSDSGLSMDHADLDIMDQQLSPLLVHSSDDDILNSSAFSNSDHQIGIINSPLASVESRSPPSSVSPAHSSTLSSDIDVGSPINYYEDNLDINNCSNIQNDQPPPAPAVQTFQNASNLKRKSTAPTAVVLPKIQKHYITKPASANTHTINATRPDGTKQRIILSNVNGGSLPSNIQIVNNKSFNVRTPDRNGGQKKLIRVAPVAGNPRSILLPVTIKDMKDFRSIKIINATDLKNPGKIQIAAANLLQKSKQASEKTRNNNILLATAAFDDSHHYIMEDSTSERGSGRSDDEDDDQLGYDDDFDPAPQANHKGQFPRLELTTEERRLLVKEGISLPSSYPLTRLEERELKRIRRKIRNKISAQDSRRRKKEYVDGLEDRVKQSTEENQTLMKRIKVLQSQNHSLATQLRKLQSLVSNGGYKSAQPATCLMVLLLSVALVIAPSLRAGAAPSNSKDLQQSNLLTSIRRALLSAQPIIPQVDANGVLMSEELIDDEFNSEELVSSVHMSEHDYPLVSNDARLTRGHLTSTGYMDIPLDGDGWPPAGKHSLSLQYPIKLENFEYDPDYDGSDLFLSHHEEVVDEDYDSKDMKYEDSIRIYDAAMEKLEILPAKESIVHSAGKMGAVLDVMPQVLMVEPRRVDGNNGVRKNYTQIRSVVMTQSPIELE